MGRAAFELEYTELSELGVSDLTCGRILRHQGVLVTRSHYLQFRDKTWMMLWKS
ncbi:MAG TPA: hypothetical protein VGS27_15720 [Candidatus Sulfotelmatobacter sp.]|nr:hypothetical protein [Candidatus Sulfotelmatobacter sp.]